MNNIKSLLCSRFKLFSMLSLCVIFSIVVLMVRMKLTHSFFYLFLVWNVFLAVIPFAITTYLISLPKLNKFVLVFWFGVWLLFLPNAPYIVTDLLHLRLSSTKFVWLDIITVISFALTGLLLFYLSFSDMIRLLENYVKKSALTFLVPFLLFLSAFGVYLGRFLRYNSWEIISRPTHILNDVIAMLLKPFGHLEVWLFTLLFGLFLNMGFWVFQVMHTNLNHSNHES